jgi:hypothetical protein
MTVDPVPAGPVAVDPVTVEVIRRRVVASFAEGDVNNTPTALSAYN